MIRLSKRMGELDMFSRREADRLIIDGRVLVDGKLVEVGQKVPSNLQADRIEVIDGDSTRNLSATSSANRKNSKNQNKSSSSIRSANQMSAVVLNKPKGYVSGQAEHGHPPAIRLLTSRNRVWGREDRQDEDNHGDGNKNELADNYDLTLDARRKRHYYDWTGFAPAGRLDMDSTGLLVFTKNGVLAKKLIGAASSVEKEYIADVEPAAKPTKRELSIDPKFILPHQRLDLTPIISGGGLLLGDDRPLKACPTARWLVKGEKLQLVLTEGRKHQIRRMCRELLGFHVVGLRRVRIGPIMLPSSTDTTNADGFEGEENNDTTLPAGCWRPLRESEMKFLISNARQ